MKLLNGLDIAEFVKERQAREARSIFQTDKIKPKLAIIACVDNPVINIYIKLKSRYGQDIGVDVDIYRIKQSEIPAKLKDLNNDQTVNGIIIQLPIEDTAQTEELVNMVSPEKDVDALGTDAKFDPATPTAILWLLAGHNIDLRGKKVLLIGEGKLVGQPLRKMLTNSGVEVEVIKKETYALKAYVRDADVIISATGSPGLIDSDMIKPRSVVVDAGVASEDGRTVGDVSDDVYSREDISITPKKGGVGPLTVCALFENVIISAKRQSQLKSANKTAK